MERKALIKRIQENPIEQINGETIISTIEQREMTYNNKTHITYWWIRKTPEGKILMKSYIGE